MHETGLYLRNFVENPRRAVNIPDRCQWGGLVHSALLLILGFNQSEITLQMQSRGRKGPGQVRQLYTKTGQQKGGPRSREGLERGKVLGGLDLLPQTRAAIINQGNQEDERNLCPIDRAFKTPAVPSRTVEISRVKILMRIGTGKKKGNLCG